MGAVSSASRVDSPVGMPAPAPAVGADQLLLLCGRHLGCDRHLLDAQGRNDVLEPARQPPVALPSSSIVAGTSTMRTIVASIATATARPRPMSFNARRSATTKLPKTNTMISAAAVITRAVDSSPSATA